MYKKVLNPNLNDKIENISYYGDNIPGRERKYSKRNIKNR